LNVLKLFIGKIGPLVPRKKFDILYYCLSGPSLFGLIKDMIFLVPLRARARKTVYHLHGGGGIKFITQHNALLRAGARLVLFEPDLILRPPSPSEEAALCQAKREIVLNNAIEDPVKMLTTSARKWPDGDLQFTFIGLLVADKGIFDLIEIARLLREQGRHFTLSIVGEGLPDVVTRLKDTIARQDLTAFVRLEGVVTGERKFQMLQQTTVFLFPTYFRAETQPTVLIEALAVGVPLVAYDWRGINTIIEQGVNGYLAPVRDTQAFCQAIERILNDGNIEEMRIHARRIFLERFTLDRHIEALRRAFDSIAPTESKNDGGKAVSTPV
jgi:glycosyltransferase involved in cell wall biosynthesis